MPPHDKVPSEYWRALFLVEVKALRFVLDLRQRWQWHIDKRLAFFAWGHNARVLWHFSFVAVLQGSQKGDEGVSVGFGQVANRLA